MKKFFKFSKKQKVPTMEDFYNPNYLVVLGAKTLEITSRNAKVFIVLQKETFTKKHYNLLKKQVKSSIRISGLYSKENEEKPRAPKGYTRKMLCYGLCLLLQHGRVTEDDVISLEADPSDNNNLVEKVYKPMGFELVAATSETITGGLMTSNVKTILSWCNEEHINEANVPK